MEAGRARVEREGRARLSEGYFLRKATHLYLLTRGVPSLLRRRAATTRPGPSTSPSAASARRLAHPPSLLQAPRAHTRRRSVHCRWGRVRTPRRPSMPTSVRRRVPTANCLWEKQPGAGICLGEEAAFAVSGR